VARAQLDVRDSRTYDGELDSMREAEQLARALEDNFGEEAEDDGEMGCSGEQMTFATLVAEARTAVERVVEFGAMGRDADPVAAHELAESLRAAADRIEARAKAGPATPQPLRS
ncbi:MAG: hypothetical protein JSS51_09640, partial [Planctomycetes bacterium]|nr:hypothetical protein [Planctomycetota bacterium]